MDILGYFNTLKEVYAKGDATEHSYRPALQQLFDQIANDTTAQNEPKQRKDVGAPDFAFHRGEVVIGWAEAKNLGHDIRKLKGYEKEQHARYVGGLDNLIYTDGLTFIFYRNGVERQEVRIGEMLMGLQPDPTQFEALEAALQDFATQTPISITSPEELAKRMAGKAKLIKQYLGESLIRDKDNHTELSDQYNTFRELMIHDISTSDFAGMYAETLAYGMFAARLHDPTPNTFSRQEALELLPKSNPFLRNLFSYIAGPNLDDRLKPIIDELAVVFKSCDVAKIMEKFGTTTGRNDPFIHFYETFLAEYDPKKRKARGVWYTPEPVVNFIVRAVDEVLQTEFGLKDGLADISKVKVQMSTGQTQLTKKGKLRKDGKAGTVTREMHRVQVLDPATGTGTFLAEVIKQIAPRIQDVAPGMWNSYVEEHLIPRLHGFEILMASYAMCHMKLDMMLREMGYKPTKEAPRLSVYLTNSLEEGEHLDARLPFERWLSDEIKKANEIKTETPIMCVIGNPPYLGEGGKSEGWIGDLMDDYKKEPGGKVRLQERNPKWLNDLYVKFIRMSSHMIEENGEGVLGFITNHGYLDNPTFRGMRWHLLKTFDKVYVLDLHGSSQKKELPPDAPRDVNVFDIKPGTSIIIAIKKKGMNTNPDDTSLLRRDVFGNRKSKYDFLATASIRQTDEWKSIPVKSNRYFFRDWEYEKEPSWSAGFSLSDLMPVSSNGIVTGKDKKVIASSEQELGEIVTENFGECDAQFIEPISYRQFETSYIYNDANLIERSRAEVMGHYKRGPNLGFLISKQVRDYSFSHIFVTSKQSEAIFLSGTTATNANNIPLYIYPTDNERAIGAEQKPNFDPKLHKKLLKLTSHKKYGKPTPEDIFDYIYAVLYCPTYRETYAEFLKIDFPRIPWPTSPDMFWELVPQGRILRRLHLMDDAAIGDISTHAFEGDGDGLVVKPEYRDGRVWINDTQSFSAVPEDAWNFYIGGYQPAQKWLKDRKGRKLEYEDSLHYQSIIKILSETDRIMTGIEIDLK